MQKTKKSNADCGRDRRVHVGGGLRSKKKGKEAQQEIWRLLNLKRCRELAASKPFRPGEGELSRFHNLKEGNFGSPHGSTDRNHLKVSPAKKNLRWYKGKGRRRRREWRWVLKNGDVQKLRGEGGGNREIRELMGGISRGKGTGKRKRIGRKDGGRWRKENHHKPATRQ